MSKWLRATVIAAVLSAGLGGAQAQVAPQAPAHAPDKPKTPPPRQTPVPVQPLAQLPPDPTLDPQGKTIARITGHADDPAIGGADCRTGCDSVYYTCLVQEEATPCAASWNRCLKACPKHSSAF